MTTQRLKKMAAWTPESKPLSRPRSARTSLKETGHGIVLCRRTGSFRGGLSQLLWLIPWTIFCAYLIRPCITESKYELVLFALPVVLFWIVGFIALMAQWIGREHLAVGVTGVTYWRSIWLTVKRLTIAAKYMRDATFFLCEIKSDSDHPQFGLKIRTAGGDIHFGKGGSDDELLWLADVIRRQTYALASEGPPPFLTERSGDAMFTVEREQHRTTFLRRASREDWLMSLGGVTLVTVFWNSILSVFVIHLFTEFQWVLFICLIPFEVVGVGLFFSWLAVLTTPFTKERFVFTPDCVGRRHSVLGVGKTRDFELSHPGRIELRRLPSSRKRRWIPMLDQDAEMDSEFGLAIVGDDGKDVLVIDSMRENEAQWVAYELFRDFEDWYVKVGKS